MDKLTVADLNAASEERASELLRDCCASSRWVDEMIARRPFKSREEIISTADEICSSFEEKDWLEAFEAHPRIGAQSAERESRRSEVWSTGEQAAVLAASLPVLVELDKVNREYENRFDFTYIVSATGKSAEEMLVLAKERLKNDRDTELRAAADEQRKIMCIRLEKALAEDM